MQITEKCPWTVHGLGVEQQDEHGPDSILFVGAVTIEVRIQNKECFVMLSGSERTYHKTQNRLGHTIFYILQVLADRDLLLILAI